MIQPQQLDLLDLPPNVRATDPHTSHLAARRDRSELRRKVVDVLSRCPGGMTDWELTAACGEPERRKGSVSKRRHDTGAVQVMVDGEPLTRLSPDGNPCIVWTLPAEAGAA